MNCCLKYNFNTRLPSPAIFPFNTLLADSSNTYHACVGTLSSFVTLAVVSVVHFLVSSLLVASAGYSPFV